ncbi:hypothetical protein DNTS_015426 [Danionella cerebrum]|uniref:BHLH domain-containing protein n=1 Tax=Danionella cerebrum TaxID=2873325 RepID=A0A553R3Z2_9TELE|nr:hypothetical protein DNTS_015426 [Danionella translucida]
MTPNILPAAPAHTFTSSMTVAQRREAHELRKTLKPLMEKRRRARINESLNHLKSLILPLVGKDASRYSKLEKADILEMTVRFLRELPSSSAKGESLLLFSSAPPAPHSYLICLLFISKGQTESYKEGYKACLLRISATVPRAELETEAHRRLSDFLRHSMLSASSSCQNCCAQSSRTTSQTHQSLASLRSSIQAENRAVSPGHHAQPAAPAPAPAGGHMWRPW